MIEHLELRNLTAFKDIALDLSPGINLIIGENGTGKTHLLKAAYGLIEQVDAKGLDHNPGPPREHERTVVAVGWTSAAQSTNASATSGGFRSRSSTLHPKAIRSICPTRSD